MEEMIGKAWGTDVTEDHVLAVAGVDEVRAVAHDRAVPADFQPGRVTIWLDTRQHIAQITHEMRSGGLLVIPSPKKTDPR